MNILHVKSIKITHALCIRRSFWRFLLFFFFVFLLFVCNLIVLYGF